MGLEVLGLDHTWVKALVTAGVKRSSSDEMLLLKSSLYKIDKIKITYCVCVF